MALSDTWRAFSSDARRFLAGGLLIELGHAFLWVLQNLYVRSVGYGEADAGTVLAAAAVGVVISTIPAAALYDSLGPRRCLMLAAVGASLSLIGLASVEGLPLLMLFAGLQGASFTVHRVVAAPFIVAVSHPSQRTRLFGAEFMTHTVASTVGLAGAGLVARLLVSQGQPEISALRLTLYVGAVLSLAAVLPYRRLSARGSSAGGAGGVDPPQAAEDAETRPPNSPLRMFKLLRPDHWHLWWRLSLPHLVVGLGAGLTIPFINLYFTDRFTLAKDRLGLVMAASQLTMTVAVMLTPRLVARMGLLKATILSELLSLPFFLTLAFTTSFPIAVVAFVLRTALMNLSHPMWRNLIMEVTPSEWRPAVNGVSMLAWNLGWAASNRWGGVLIERSGGSLGEGVDGYAAPMLITLSLYVLAIALEALFFWNKRHIGKQGAQAEAGA